MLCLFVLSKCVEHFLCKRISTLTITIKCLKPTYKPIGVLIKSHRKRWQTPTHSETYFLICPIADMKILVKQCDEAVASREGSFYLRLPFLCGFNIVVCNETRDSKLKERLLQLRSKRPMCCKVR